MTPLALTRTTDDPRATITRQRRQQRSPAADVDGAAVRAAQHRASARAIPLLYLLAATCWTRLHRWRLNSKAAATAVHP